MCLACSSVHTCASDSALQESSFGKQQLHDIWLIESGCVDQWCGIIACSDVGIGTMIQQHLDNLTVTLQGI